MTKPIKNVDEINYELIHNMTRESMSIDWIKDFYTSECDGIFSILVNKNWTVIIRGEFLRDLHHEDIARRVSEIMRFWPRFCIDTTDTLLKI